MRLVTGSLSLIKQISFAPIDKVTLFTKTSNDTVRVEASWITIPMYVTSGYLNSSTIQGASGSSYKASLSARLQKRIGVTPYCLIKVELCSGENLIIGTPDIPVRSSENVTLSMVKFDVNHNSIDPPLMLID